MPTNEVSRQIATSRLRIECGTSIIGTRKDNKGMLVKDAFVDAGSLMLVELLKSQVYSKCGYVGYIKRVHVRPRLPRRPDVPIRKLMRDAVLEGEVGKSGLLAMTEPNANNLK